MSESIYTKEGYIRPAILLSAYRSGAFPMALDDSGEIGWFSPDPRGVIPLETFHIPRGLRKALKKEPFEIRIDTAFLDVVDACADRKTTWINDSIRTSYANLFDLGFAHSVEAWQENQLVGGLYGVSIGGAFFGESMFSRVTDASKVALVHLVDRMKSNGFTLLDTQWTTPHLQTFGGLEIPRDDYLHELTAAMEIETSFL